MFVDAGSRYEGPGEYGSCHLLEAMGFRSTTRRDTLTMSNEMTSLGGGVSVNGSREQYMVCVDVLRNNASSAFNLMADAINNPLDDSTEVSEALYVMGLQHGELPVEMEVKEGIQIAGYGTLASGEAKDDKETTFTSPQRLGRGYFAEPDDIKNLTRESLKSFRSQHFIGPKTVLAGAGVDHDDFVELANIHFGSMPSAPPSGVITPSPPSVYTGGEYRLNKDSVDGYTKLAIGFPVGGWHSEDLVPTCVMQVRREEARSKMKPRKSPLIRTNNCCADGTAFCSNANDIANFTRFASLARFCLGEVIVFQRGDQGKECIVGCIGRY